ncbi:PDZ domain-containing protein [bacterium]|nr:PDZ domain-containing protein [bacterium]
MRRPVSAWTFALVLSLTACGGPEKAPSATSSSPARPAPAATGTQGHPPAPAPSAERLTTLPAALERARKENEPVLAVFYAPTWSPPCAALKRSLLDSPEFKAWAASHVVLLVLDFPKEADNERNDLARRYEIIGFPTLLVLDASGRQLGKIDGARDASSVIARANEIIDSPHPAPPAPSEPKPAAAPSPERPFLGLSLIDGDGRGPLTVDQVVADSPAAAVGIRSGDRILEIDNKPVKTVGDVETAVRGRSVGDKVLIRLSRDGFEKAMTVTLRARGASQPSTPKTPDPAPPPESVAGKELRSQDGSVSLVVPRAAEGWARRTEGLLGTELFAMGRPDGEQSATISVDLLPADYAATEEGAFERARRDHGTKGELIDLPAGRFLRIDMEWQWERQPRKTRRCLAFRAGRAYLVQLSAAAQRIQVHLPLFEEIVSLVRFPAETKPPEPRAPVEPAPKPPAPAPPTGTPGAGGTFVLVVGVNEYKDPKIPKLKLAEDDARAVYSFFATEEKSPTAADRVKILRGADATRLGILKAIREHLTAKATRAEDTVILYFAGHGFADAKETYRRRSRERRSSSSGRRSARGGRSSSRTPATRAASRACEGSRASSALPSPARRRTRSPRRPGRARSRSRRAASTRSRPRTRTPATGSSRRPS